MADFIVGSIVLLILGCVVYKMFFKNRKKKDKGCCGCH